METIAPQSHICFGSLCCEDHGGKNAEREETAAVEDRNDIAADAIEVMAEREEPAVEVMSSGGEQAMEVVAASGEQAMEVVMAVSGEGEIEPVAAREEPAIDIMGESVEPAPGVRIPRSLPPAPLRGSWNRTEANYEEARKRLMQAPAAPDPIEKGLVKAPPTKRRVTGVAAPTRAPSGAPVDYCLTRVIASQVSASHVEKTVIARAAAPSGERDDRRKPKVSAQLGAHPAETVSAPSRALPLGPRDSAPSRVLPNEPRDSAPPRALPDEPRVSAQLSEPVPRWLRVAALNRAILDQNFVTKAPAPSPPLLVMCNDTASGVPPAAAKSLAAAKTKAPRAAKSPRAPKAKKSRANLRQLTAPPTPKSTPWALLLVVGLCCAVGLVTIALILRLQHAHGP